MTALRHPILWILLVLVALTIAWDAIGAPVSLITQIAIYTLYGAGVNLLVGYTGLVPFGASVFFGCASYAVAISMRGFLGNEAEALVFAVAFSLLLAAAIALIILRRRGLYFSLLTLAFSQIAFEIAYKWTDLTGGENGLQGVPRPWLVSDWSFHVFTVLTVTGAMWLLWRIAHAPFGRALQALRDNEQRMQSLGYSTFRLKFEAFVILGGVVGYAGALLALMLRGAYADNLGWQHAGDALLMTVLGGVHQFLGPLWGAIAFTLLQDRLSAITESWWLMFAPIIILFALLSPEGIQGAVQRLLRREQRWTLVRSGVPPRPDHIAPFRDTEQRDMHADQPILTVRGLHKRFGSLVVAADVQLDVHPYRLHSLIGPNGAGKTTLFNMLTGLLRADAGQIVFNGRDIAHLPVHRRIRLGLGRSFQILSVFRNLTTFENVRVAVQARSPLAEQPVARCLRDRGDQCPHLVAAGRCRAGGSRGRALRQSVAWRTAAAGDRHRAGHGREAAAAGRTAGGSGGSRPRGGWRADPPARHDACRAADRARHRSRAGAVGSHHGAAPGPRDR